MTDVVVPVPEEVLAPLAGRPLPPVVKQALRYLHAGELAQAEALMRKHLTSAAASADPAVTRTAFILLLYLLGEQRKHEEAGAAFAAPWSPLRAEGQVDFDRMYGAAIAATGSLPLPFKRRARFLELVRQLASTRGVAGAIAECGCFRGLSSHLLCQSLAAESPGFDGAGYHIFDSFAGLSDPMAEDAVPADHPNRSVLEHVTQAGAFAATLDTVRRNLARFPGIAYHPGWIPLSFDTLPEQRYRFVHLDVDLYDPTLDCLEYFHPRVAAGGAIVSDDYSWPGARLAIEEFCAARGLSFTVTDFEQAVIRL